ncbi:HPP family protein [Litoribrevibacter albus]|uniref:HPP transmembrane region domain-containing protein n=1 Tax=Litoribrevibacter albus TaxID=1473156 RepID=A0AA37S851_9GAMM|nr:HPP family protein [Litoribrevibacter albus]GLQ30019.1 hypothetical protein GCM10007876_04970 [Litoribrevibacter albus]
MSFKEKLTSALGAALAITLLCLSSLQAETSSTQILLQASIGASAILIFAVPHGPLSQPWPVFGGHILSACIGVTCYQHIEEPTFAAAAAVGLSTFVMCLGRCLHPPGGATALTAVIGGTEIHNLGYQYVFTPILTNVLVLLSTALVIHYLFQTHSYPARRLEANNKSLNNRNDTAEENVAKRHLNNYQPIPPSTLTEQDYMAALESMGSYMDVSIEDLKTIVSLATKHAEKVSQGSALAAMETPSYLVSTREI